MSCEIKSALRVNYTKLRLSSHKFLVERARWGKVKIPYTQRRWYAVQQWRHRR